MGSVGSTVSQSKWEANNIKIQNDFAKWLDSRDRKPFEADQYNVFEKLTLDEVRKYLRTEEEGYNYYSDNEVPADESWYIKYKDGTTVYLSEGDSIKGVRRTGILFAVNENPGTTAIYGKSKDIKIENTSDYSEHNDIWRVK